MKVFVYDYRTNGRIAALCQKIACSVLTAQQVQRRRHAPKNNRFFLHEVDALLLEITTPTTDSHFMMAQAILAQKPILCLYRKNFPPHEMLRIIQEHRVATAQTFSYSKRNIAEGIRRFITEFHPSGKSRDEEASIKYTLRLSPKSDRYIAWVCKRERISKADYFRLFLEHQQNHDSNYVDPGPKCDRNKRRMFKARV